VFILEGLKVLCFDTLLQVFILKYIEEQFWLCERKGDIGDRSGGE